MMRTKYTRSNAMVMLGQMALLVLTVSGISGCTMGGMIIPTPSHGGVGIITKETIESFEPGKTTRADILLRLGDPDKRLKEDRFFVYQWKRIHWYFFVILGDKGGGDSIRYWHYLGLEFTPDNRVKRVKVIDPWWFSFSDQYPRLQQWMDEEHQLPD